VSQNNCQFYHPEEDYPQYKAKKAAMTKKEKQNSKIIPLKIVTRQIRPSVKHNTVASKAYAGMAGLQIKKKAVSSKFSTPNPLSKSNKIIQPPVKTVQCSPHKEVPTPLIRHKVARGLDEDHYESVNNHAGLSGGQVTRVNEPSLHNYITKINEQKVFMRDLQGRIRKAERTIEFNRERAAELKSSKQRFFSSWSRAVRTLELIRESGTLLDENIVKVIDIHSAALRRHDNCSIYAPGLADLNPSLRKTSYFQHMGVEEHSSFCPVRDTFFHHQRSSRTIGYEQNSMFSHEPGSCFFEDDQDLVENSAVDDSFENFVAENMFSSLEL